MQNMWLQSVFELAQLYSVRFKVYISFHLALENDYHGDKLFSRLFVDGSSWIMWSDPFEEGAILRRRQDKMERSDLKSVEEKKEVKQSHTFFSSCSIRIYTVWNISLNSSITLANTTVTTDRSLTMDITDTGHIGLLSNSLGEVTVGRTYVRKPKPLQ